MPQSPLAANVAVNPSKKSAPLNTDPQGALLSVDAGTTNTYNIAAATIIKAAPGRVARVSVITAGSAAGSLNDCLTTGAAAIGNQVAAIPNTVSVIYLEWQCTTGIVIVPGTAQVLAVSFA